jgi:hypothetical protein
MEPTCLSNTGPFWSIMGVVPKVWYKEVQLRGVYSDRHYCTRICWWGGGHFCCKQPWLWMHKHAVMVMAETGKLDQHGAVRCDLRSHRRWNTDPNLQGACPVTVCRKQVPVWGKAFQNGRTDMMNWSCKTINTDNKLQHVMWKALLVTTDT